MKSLIDLIPSDAEVTVYLKGGRSVTGFNETTNGDAKNGLFAVFARVSEGAGNSRKSYMLAEDIRGFDVVCDEV
jgi:hypothetical protein